MPGGYRLSTKTAQAMGAGDEPGDRRCQGVRVSQVRIDEGEIALGHRKVRMAHDALEGKDIAAAPQKLQGKGVTQVIGTASIVQLLPQPTQAP